MTCHWPQVAPPPVRFPSWQSTVDRDPGRSGKVKHWTQRAEASRVATGLPYRRRSRVSRIRDCRAPWLRRGAAHHQNIEDRVTTSWSRRHTIAAIVALVLVFCALPTFVVGRFLAHVLADP
jgi:hypothetical protein